MFSDDAPSEADLATLIPAFYARVRRDPLIGPVFNAVVADWGHHLDVLTDFWSSVMRTSGRYKGNPMAAHGRLLDRITPEMFDRWLALWASTTDDMLPPDHARAMQEKAGRIAESLKLGLWFRLPARASGAKVPAETLKG